MRDSIRHPVPDPRRPTLFERLTRVLRGIAGMPDYAAYVEHQRRCHPGTAPLAERDFFAEYLRARYSDGPNRCC